MSERRPELQEGGVRARIVRPQKKTSNQNLEEDFRLESEQRQKVLRSNIVQEKKRELSRTLTDVESQLCGILATNQTRLQEHENLFKAEKRVNDQLLQLEADLHRLKTDDDWMEGDDLVKVNADIESIRRSIMTLQMRSNESLGNFSSSGSTLDIGSISFAQVFRLGLAFSLPIAFAIVLSAAVIASVLWSLLA